MVDLLFLIKILFILVLSVSLMKLKIVSRKYLCCVILVFGVVLFGYQYMSFKFFKEFLLGLHSFFSSNFVFGIILFLIFCIFLINSPFSVTATLKIFAGFVYGAFGGMLISVVGFTLASVIGFWLTRVFFRDMFQAKYRKRVAKVNSEIKKNGFYYFLSLRLIFLVPHFVINILGGLSQISFRQFFLSTFLGVIPEVIVYSYAGSRLTSLAFSVDVFTTDVIVAFGLIIAMSLIPTFIKLFKFHKRHRSL